MDIKTFNIIVQAWPLLTKISILLGIAILHLKKTDYTEKRRDLLKRIVVWSVLFILWYETSGVLLVLFRRLYSLGYFS